MNQANRNQVSLYSIDPWVLMVVPFDLSVFYDVGDMESPQEFLATLSEDTGGVLYTKTKTIWEIPFARRIWTAEPTTCWAMSPR